MAYTLLNIGYTPNAGYNYTATTDTSADWGSVPNDTFFFNKSDKQVYYKNANGFVVIPSTGGELGVSKNISSSQWNTTIPFPIAIPNGVVANALTLFDNVTDKVANGTTDYDEYNITFGISILLSGVVGGATITVDGFVFPCLFNTDLFTTAQNWVATNEAQINSFGIKVFAVGSGANGEIRFSGSEVQLNTITCNNSGIGDLNGSVENKFTGDPVAFSDHIVIPYEGKPYFNQRLFHTMRVNFNIATGSIQYSEFGLYRYEDDTLIGATQLLLRNPDVTGVQAVIETYTSGANDPFVDGGFYVGLKNSTGLTLNFENDAGFLIQNKFESSLDFN